MIQRKVETTTRVHVDTLIDLRGREDFKAYLRRQIVGDEEIDSISFHLERVDGDYLYFFVRLFRKLGLSDPGTTEEVQTNIIELGVMK
jgi:hypothetical protein